MEIEIREGSGRPRNKEGTRGDKIKVQEGPLNVGRREYKVSSQDTPPER